MTSNNVTILLARQRSGTNALRSVLTTHPEIHCFDEVFKLEARFSPLVDLRAGNYFTFLEQYCAGDISRAFPDRHAEVFDAYVEYLQGLTGKRLIVIDVKYNSTHHLNGTWREIAEPTLFPLLRDRRVRVLHLTRRNLLRSLVSNMKLWESGCYIVRRGTARPADGRVTLPSTWVLQRLEQWAAEDTRVAASFDGYEHYRRFDYTDLFPEATGEVALPALRELWAWFGVPEGGSGRASIAKQSSLPLADTIENFDELSAVLRGTPFEDCLDDEPGYRTAAGRAPARAAARTVSSDNAAAAYRTETPR